MKNKKLQKILSLTLGGAIALACSSCSLFSNAELLAEPAKAEALHYSVHQEESFKAFKEKANEFAARFSAVSVANEKADENVAVAPVSVFMALSLAAECLGGNAQEEVLSALGVGYEELRENASKLYRSINVEKKNSKAVLSNSIWVNTGTEVYEEKINALAENYYCYSYRADFLNENAKANRAIKKFVKDSTRGLIDEDFELSKETLFALINTLYLKTNWNYNGTRINLTDKEYTFTESDGEKEQTKLLERSYLMGRAYEDNGFTSFYTSTSDGYKLKFLLPNEGVRLKDVFTWENVHEINSVTDYNAEDEEELKRYYTRCLFPQFEADYDGNVRELLQADFGVNGLFDSTVCDFSPLMSTPAFCEEVRHVTELKVDRRGIEGAAVTVIPGAKSAGPDEYEEVYLDFVVDRAFGFVITDSYNTVLFSGVVNELDD